MQGDELQSFYLHWVIVLYIKLTLYSIRKAVLMTPFVRSADVTCGGGGAHMQWNFSNHDTQESVLINQGDGVLITGVPSPTPTN